MLAYCLPVFGLSDLDLVLSPFQALCATTAGLAAASPLVLDSLPAWLRGALPTIGEGTVMVAAAVVMFALGAILLLAAVRRSRRAAAAEELAAEPELQAPELPPVRPSGLRGRSHTSGQAATARSNEPMGDDDRPMPETKIESTLFAQPPTREILGWIVFQDQRGTRLPIGLRSLRIGRHPDNDIQLENRTVHRFHATMQMGPAGVFTITDLGTLNKVFVNRKAHKEVTLRSGDLVQLGEVRFKFYAGSDGPPQATA